MYGWSALNYLDDAFDSATERESMVEMGGASTQIAFLSDDAGNENVLHRTYRGNEYEVFAKSYLEMGQDRALELVSSTSCFPKGYALEDHGASGVGAGDFSACTADIIAGYRQLCDSLGVSDCLFDSGFVANTENEFIAIAAYYYTFSFLGFSEDVNLDTLQLYGTDFCGKTWEEVQAEHAETDPSYLKAYCFNSAYFYALLHNGYLFDNSVELSTENEVGDTEVSWTLGAIIDIEMGHQPQKH